MNQQLSLASIYDPSLPVECSGPELGDTIARVEAAGLCVRRLDVVGAAGYRLHLQRKASVRVTLQDLQGVTFAALVVALNAAAFSLR